MATPATLSLTVEGCYQQNYPFAIVIGGKRIPPPGQNPNNCYWFLVLDRVTLSPVMNVYSSSYNSLPPGLLQYDTDEYLMIVVSIATLTMYYPQGALFDFLVAHGGSGQLRRLAQVVTDLGCGNIATVAYTLVSVLGEGDYGFDQSSIPMEPAPLMTLQLMPVDVGGKYFYTPITLPN